MNIIQQYKLFYISYDELLEEIWGYGQQFDVLPGERAYIVTKKVVQSTPLYKKQLICLRYIHSLRVVNNLEEGRLVKEVPVAKIIRSNRGIYFIVDRERVTQSYHQRKQRKQCNQLAGVIAEETFRNY